MTRTLQPHQFKVFDGKKTWTGEEVIEFFKFDPTKCKITVEDFGIHIAQEGCSGLMLMHGVQIEQSSSEAS